MLTNETHVVLWRPRGNTYSYPDPNYTDLIERYLRDVAHDSGRTSNTNSVTTQYYKESSVGSQQFIQYHSVYAGTLFDEDPYPPATSECTRLKGAATTCLTQEQETDELETFLQGHLNSRSFEHDIWLLVLPPNVQTCASTYVVCGPYGPGTKGASYCAYHSEFGNDQISVAWANIPYVPASRGCLNYSEPNHNSADTTINTLSHEMSETITDPVGESGWIDEEGRIGEDEIADQCNFQFPATPLGSTTGSAGNYDELINGDPYNVQEQWSNFVNGCAMNYGHVAPTAAFSYTPKPLVLVGQTVEFNPYSSQAQGPCDYLYTSHFDFGDGQTLTEPFQNRLGLPVHAYAKPGKYTITLTVTDDAGTTNTTTQTITVLPPPPPREPVNYCVRGALSQTSVQNLIVANVCDMTQVVVTGNLMVQRGGRLHEHGSVIDGNLQATDAAAIQLGGGGSIGGNLQVQSLTLAPAGSDDSLCNTIVKGNVQVQNNGASSPVDIGSLAGCSGEEGLTIGGNLEVENNAAGITVGANRVTGNLQVHNNTAKVTVTGNTANNNIQVHDNTIGVGGTLERNTAGGNCELHNDNPTIEGAGNAAAAGHQNSCNGNS